MIGIWLIESRLMRMIEMGKLSKESIARAGKAGMFKPYKTWQSGMEQGTQNILKRAGYKVDKIQKNPLFSHADLVSRKVRVVNPQVVVPKERGFATLVKRHEADEALAQMKNIGNRKKHTAMLAAISQGPNRSKVINKPKFFSHESPTVLQKEQKYANVANSLYGKKSGADMTLKMRGLHKEYAVLNNKSATKRFHNKVKNAYQSDIDTGTNYIKNMPKKQAIKGKIELQKSVDDMMKNVATFEEPGTARELVKKVIQGEKLKRVKTTPKVPTAASTAPAAAASKKFFKSAFEPKSVSKVKKLKLRLDRLNPFRKSNGIL